MNSFTYIIQLKDNYWYVGYTENLANRIESHFADKPQTRWLQLHKPVRLYMVLAGNVEKATTISMMKKFGWTRVRGYCWVKVNLQSAPKELTKRIT